MEAKKEFDVLSPDGFSIHHSDTYKTSEDAERALIEWVKRYEQQGYYSSSSNGRISLDELPDYCKIIDVLQHNIDAIFVSVWDGGDEIRNSCKFNLETNDAFDIESVDFESLEMLDEQYVELPNGEVIKTFTIEGNQKVVNGMEEEDEEPKIECGECGWTGTPDELKTSMDSNPNNSHDHTIYENKVCPDCTNIIFKK